MSTPNRCLSRSIKPSIRGPAPITQGVPPKNGYFVPRRFLIFPPQYNRGNCIPPPKSGGNTTSDILTAQLVGGRQTVQRPPGVLLIHSPHYWRQTQFATESDDKERSGFAQQKMLASSKTVALDVTQQTAAHAQITPTRGPTQRGQTTKNKV